MIKVKFENVSHNKLVIFIDHIERNLDMEL